MKSVVVGPWRFTADYPKSGNTTYAGYVLKSWYDANPGAVKIADGGRSTETGTWKTSIGSGANTYLLCANATAVLRTICEEVGIPFTGSKSTIVNRIERENLAPVSLYNY